jgi:alpha-D-ribose 1-methylphosphonate 5-triphosphate synthase subunit PhnG
MSIPENSPAEPDPAARRRWMRLFALADAGRLRSAAEGIDAVRLLRAPEIGLAMVRGRIGGGGAPFNLGEVPVTRCSVALANGVVGHAYLAGRDREKARAAAILDALMQTEAAPAIERELLTPLEAEIRRRDANRNAKVAATRVDFFTLVRGD